MTPYPPPYNQVLIGMGDWGGVLTKNTYVGIVQLNEGHDSGTSNLA